MKFLTTFTLFLCSIAAFAQKEIPVSTSIEVTGKVKKVVTFSIADLRTYAVKNIGKVTITNHVGEKRNTLKKLKGVLLTDLLSKVELDEASPKLWSEFYFIFEATDGYKVVYSWNELFNNEGGNSVYLITEKEGQGIETLDGRIASIAPKDIQTGRRYVKGLKKITVGRVQ